MSFILSFFKIGLKLVLVLDLKQSSILLFIEIILFDLCEFFNYGIPSAFLIHINPNSITFFGIRS